MKKFIGVLLIAIGLMVFANLVIFYAPTMLSATIIKHLTVIARISGAAVLIAMGGIAFTSNEQDK